MGNTSLSWTNKTWKYSTPDSFLFRLTNLYGTEPTKFPNRLKTEENVYHNIIYGPCFGNYDDIKIISDFKNNGLNTGFPTVYEDTLEKGKSILDDFNNKVQIKI